MRERALHDEVSLLRQERDKGRREGILEGEAVFLERQIVRRFGPLSTENRLRLKNATGEQLERWGERILDAPNLTAVFDK